MVQNGYNTYKNNSVLTAKPQELTLMLYNGAIKFCNQATIEIDNKNPAKVNEYLIRVQDIIDEFRITLDKKYPISENMDKLYEYMNWRLMNANINKDKEIISEVTDMLREMRDTWKQAMVLARTEEKAVINA